MKTAILSATTQFQENTFNKKLWLKIYQELYIISKTEFSEICTVCYEIDSNDSYCNCNIPTIGKRTDLKKFVYLYEFANNNIEDIMANNYIYISPDELKASSELFEDNFVKEFKVQFTPKPKEQIPKGLEESLIFGKEYLF